MDRNRGMTRRQTSRAGVRAATQKLRSRNEKEAWQRAMPLLALGWKLFFVAFFFHGLDAAIVCGLRFRLFERFLGFGGFLGASFGAFFALLVQNLLAAEQFQKGLVGAIALIPRGA